MYEAEHLPEYAYFITSGMASVVTSMEDGGTAEVAIIGSEGLVGALHLMGPGTVFTDSFVQIEGTALRIRLSDLRKLFRSTEQVVTASWSSFRSRPELLPRLPAATGCTKRKSVSHDGF